MFYIFYIIVYVLHFDACCSFHKISEYVESKKKKMQSVVLIKTIHDLIHHVELFEYGMGIGHISCKD